MNRIVLIGNGFDLAHDLKTSYKNFIEGYWQYRFSKFAKEYSVVSKDLLCTLERQDGNSWYIVYQELTRRNLAPLSGEQAWKYIREDRSCNVTYSDFFGKIIKSIETKGWVDIENEYYSLLKEYAFESTSSPNNTSPNGQLEDESIEKIKSLNSQLEYLKSLLVDYLKSIENTAKNIESIKEKMYAPISVDEVSVEGQRVLKDWVDFWIEKDKTIFDKLWRYGLTEKDCLDNIQDFYVNYPNGDCSYTDAPDELLLPDAVTILNFNYTNTPELYYNENLGSINYIHGKVDDLKTVIFGYGDELDARFKELQNFNENECLKNIKTIKYLETNKYREILKFMESAPYQVCIMGHSCGNSDRTLLNTLFEHKNCISIKPYYHQIDEKKDDYIEKIQNISRNFTDMKLMRDRVVNKEYCEPLTPYQ